MSLDPVLGGGTAERTFQISRFLTKRGIGCDILTVVAKLTRVQMQALSDVTIIKNKCLSERYYIPSFQFADINAAVANADVVHLMNHWTFINAYVYMVARRMGKPYAVCPAGALSISGRSKLVKRLYNQIVGRRIITHAAAHIAISKNETDQYAQYGVDPSNITIIPNGIDPLDYDRNDVEGFREKYRLGHHPFILFVGRLNWIKGPDLLLDAFVALPKEYHDVHLVFAGPDGGMLSALKDKVSASNLEARVHFTGYLGGIEKSSAYHAANLLVIPSRQEAMSIVALEAGINATPVLLTNRCGFDAIVHIDGGDVVDASVIGIRQGLEEMLKSGSQVLNKKGQNLKRYTLMHFTWEKVIDSYIELFDVMIHRRT